MGKGGKNRQPAIALIFMKKKYILLNDINEFANSDFMNIQLPIEITNKVEI